MGSSRIASVLGGGRSCSEKPPPHHQPRKQERWLASFCLSIVCLFCLPWLPQHPWLPVSLGWEEVEGRKVGWGVGEVHTSFVPQIKKAEMDRKTLDWEIVELTNKLLDAKNTINKLEELNVRVPWGGPCLLLAVPWPGPAARVSEGEAGDPRLCVQERYRLDCNLAVQLLKCNKSHFRNHKFADVSRTPSL